MKNKMSKKSMIQENEGEFFRARIKKWNDRNQIRARDYETEGIRLISD